MVAELELLWSCLDPGPEEGVIQAQRGAVASIAMNTPIGEPRLGDHKEAWAIEVAIELNAIGARSLHCTGGGDRLRRSQISGKRIFDRLGRSVGRRTVAEGHRERWGQRPVLSAQRDDTAMGEGGSHRQGLRDLSFELCELVVELHWSEGEGVFEDRDV